MIRNIVSALYKVIGGMFCYNCGYGFGGRKPPERGDVGEPIGPNDIPYEEDKPCPNCGFLRYSADRQSAPYSERRMPDKENKYWVSFVTEHTPSTLVGPAYNLADAEHIVNDISSLDTEIYTLRDRLNNNGTATPEGKQEAKEYGESLRGNATIISEARDGIPNQDDYDFTFHSSDLKNKYREAIESMREMADEMQREAREARPSLPENEQ